MSKLAICLIAAAVTLTAVPASATDAAGYGVKNTRHSVAVRKARASYAYAPHRRHTHFRGAAINPRDPIKRALDDPYMYGRPDRH